MVINLTLERALIFRITHIANVPWILDHVAVLLCVVGIGFRRDSALR